MLALRPLQTAYRRLMGLLLTTAFLAGALWPRLQWECPDGTPCPPRCPMRHQVLTGRTDAGAPELLCGRCVPDTPEDHPAGRVAADCSAAHCVLAAPAPMDALRVERVSLSTHEIALPLLPYPGTVAPCIFLPIFFQAREAPFPGSPLTPCTGRSPPVFCA